MGVLIDKQGIKRPAPKPPQFADDNVAVCKRCHYVLWNREAYDGGGFFEHDKNEACSNYGKGFTFDRWPNLKHPEVKPFLRKRHRRSAKRAGVR